MLGGVFNFTGSEVIFLLVAGLIVLGPERLPGVIRTVGRTYAELRKVTKGLQDQFNETFEEPIRDFRRAAEDVRNGFGEIDTEPTPPMRPEKAVLPTEDGTDGNNT